MQGALILFTKVPQAGFVKTRLTGLNGISAEDACNLYSAILADVHELMVNVASSKHLGLYVFYTPTDRLEILKELLGNNANTTTYYPQEGTKTGERIAKAFERILKDGNDAAIMVFGDQPGMDKEPLLEAYQKLDSSVARKEQRCVLGPTCDGGTFLIGITNGLSDWLNNSIDCTNTSKAVSRLIVRARDTNIRVTLLNERVDLDDPADLLFHKSQPLNGFKRTSTVLRLLPQIPQHDQQSISVIVPTLNEERNLERTITSIRAQEHPCMEIVIVDGDSDDNTLKIANNLADRVILVNRASRQHQENVGAKGAKGDILLFLHAGTLVSPTLLKSITTALRDPKVVAGGAHLAYLPQRLRYRVLCTFREKVNGILRISGMGSSFFIRKETWQRIGGFDEKMNEEGVDMSKRLHPFGKVIILDECVQTSARRYETSGFMKTIFVWSLTVGLSYLGLRTVSIERFLWRVVR